MRSATVNLLYDQLFVKEPGSSERTPWHQDLPYWPVEGDQILSIWVPFDAATPDNGVVTYVKGSHLWGQKYRPWRLKTYIAFSDEPRAFQFEKYLKTASGRPFAKNGSTTGPTRYALRLVKPTIRGPAPSWDSVSRPRLSRRSRQGRRRTNAAL